MHKDTVQSLIEYLPIRYIVYPPWIPVSRNISEQNCWMDRGQKRIEVSTTFSLTAGCFACQHTSRFFWDTVEGLGPPMSFTPPPATRKERTNHHVRKPCVVIFNYAITLWHTSVMGKYLRIYHINVYCKALTVKECRAASSWHYQSHIVLALWRLSVACDWLRPQPAGRHVHTSSQRNQSDTCMWWTGTELTW